MSVLLDYPKMVRSSNQYIVFKDGEVSARKNGKGVKKDNFSWFWIITAGLIKT